MIENFYSGVIKLAVAFVPLLLGIIAHEVAHGYAAYRCGDPTAKMLGRLTLNPLPHIDPMGLFAFVATALVSPFIFGWAKPVPVNQRMLKNPAKDMMFISFAGPLTNFILAIFFALLLKILITIAPLSDQNISPVWIFFLLMFQNGIVINLVLAWVNLLPIPPLDGSHIVEGILPYKWAVQYNKIGRYGFFILLILLMTNILSRVLWPLVSYSTDIITNFFGII